LSSFSLTNSRIQPPTIDSNTFDNVEVKDLGRRSDSIFLGGLVLGIGTTLAFFHMVGKIIIELLINKYEPVALCLHEFISF